MVIPSDHSWLRTQKSGNRDITSDLLMLLSSVRARWKDQDLRIIIKGENNTFLAFKAIHESKNLFIKAYIGVRIFQNFVQNVP